ncbi:MAG: response regulator transcription factor [Gammaproteobacteria bacterium]
MVMPSKCVVHVVDDDDEVRRGLKWLLASAHFPVRDYPTAEDFLARYCPGQPGCIILDVVLPDMDGFELLARIRGLGPHPPVLMLTAYGDIPMAVRALKSGAVDFIEKPYTDEQLLEHIERALRRDRKRLRHVQERAQMAEHLACLTPREREVMDLVVQGHRSQRIAKKLGISERTVETHRQRIMDKMHVGSVAELVRVTIVALGHP